jgi:hypothetical protein
MNRDEFIKELKEALRNEFLKKLSGAERDIIVLRYSLGVDPDTLMPTIHTRATSADEGTALYANVVGLDKDKLISDIDRILKDTVTQISKALADGIDVRSIAVPLNDRESTHELIEELNDWEQRMRTKH